MDAVAGPIDTIEYTGDPATMLALTTRHRSGAIGQAFISSVVPGYLADLEVFGPDGILSAPDRSDAETHHDEQQGNDQDNRHITNVSRLWKRLRLGAYAADSSRTAAAMRSSQVRVSFQVICCCLARRK